MICKQKRSVGQTWYHVCDRWLRVREECEVKEECVVREECEVIEECEVREEFGSDLISSM